MSLTSRVTSPAREQTPIGQDVTQAAGPDVVRPAVAADDPHAPHKPEILRTAVPSSCRSELSREVRT